METFHSKNYGLSEPFLDKLEHNLGPNKQDMEFVVEHAIHDAVEFGYDGYTIDGQYADAALIGVESKDKAYIGKTMAYDELPEDVRSVNAKLAPVLQYYQYRGFLSTEIRSNADGAFLIDPCCRAGSPPNELYQMMIGNLAEILWHGADGTMIEPEYTAKWGAELMISSEWAMTDWQPVEFPPDIRENVKLRNLAVRNGKHYYIPDKSGCSAIGAIVATGNSAQAAIDACREIAEQVEGQGIEMHPDALDEARDDLTEFLADKSGGRRRGKRRKAIPDMADIDMSDIHPLLGHPDAPGTGFEDEHADA
jgi:hypothetical protein